MTDLYVCVVSSVLAVSVWAFLVRRSRWWRLVAVPLVMLALGLALRFCGRTYPGIYYPNSRFLNDLLNGSGLFTDIGYGLVLAFGLAEAAFVFLTVFRQQPSTLLGVRLLGALRLALFAVILLIIAYGSFYAVVFWGHWSV